MWIEKCHRFDGVTRFELLIIEIARRASAHVDCQMYPRRCKRQQKMQVIRPPHAEMANIQFWFSFTFAMWFKCNVTGNYCSKVVIWLWLVQHEWVGTFGSRSLQGTAETHKGSPSRCLSFVGGYHRSPSTSSGELCARLSQNVTVTTAHFGGTSNMTVLSKLSKALLKSTNS